MLDLCWKTMNSQFFVFINDSIFMNEIYMRLDDYNIHRSLICTKLYSGIQTIVSITIDLSEQTKHEGNKIACCNKIFETGICIQQIPDNFDSVYDSIAFTTSYTQLYQRIMHLYKN